MADDPLDEFPVTIEVPVWWGDQDAFGHVNNTVYLRWFESARIAYSERSGLADLYRTRKVGPILASISCQFRRQVRYPEVVRVGARVTRIGRTSLTMDHLAVSRSEGAIVAEGSSVLVVFDYGSNTSFPVPESLREAIGRLEGRSVSDA